MSELQISNDVLKAIRNSAPVKRELIRRAEKIADATRSIGNPKPSDVKVTDLVLEEPRGAVSVMVTGSAVRSNRKHNSLIRSIGAGRD